MSEEKQFQLSIGAGMHSETRAGVVTMAIEGTEYQTQMAPQEAINLAANFIKAAHVAEQNAVLFDFFTQLGNLPEPEIMSMLSAVGAYMQSDAEERERMKTEIRAVRDMVAEMEGPPSPEKIERARQAYEKRNGGRHE
jgi:hypothetical protein